MQTRPDRVVQVAGTFVYRAWREGVTMKTWSMMAAVLVMALTASLVMAEGAEHKANKKLGAISKIDGANVTITLKAMPDAKPAEFTFATDDKTTVKVGDKTTVSALAVGDKVVVVLTEDGKTAVSINAPMEGKKKNK
jgi:hypothetical protein